MGDIGFSSSGTEECWYVLLSSSPMLKNYWATEEEGEVSDTSWLDVDDDWEHGQGQLVEFVGLPTYLFFKNWSFKIRSKTFLNRKKNRRYLDIYGSKILKGSVGISSLHPSFWLPRAPSKGTKSLVACMQRPDRISGDKSTFKASGGCSFFVRLGMFLFLTILEIWSGQDNNREEGQGETKEPDRLFRNFRALRPGDRRILFSST